MAEVGDHAWADASGVVVDGGGVGEHDGVGDQRPEPGVTPADLLFGYAVPPGGDTGRHAGDGELLGDNDDVERRVVAGCPRVASRSSFEGCEKTVSAMKGSRRVMRASRVAAAMRAAS